MSQLWGNTSQSSLSKRSDRVSEVAFDNERNLSSAVTAQVQPKKISSLGGSAYGGNHRWTLINTDIKLFFHPSGFR